MYIQRENFVYVSLLKGYINVVLEGYTGANRVMLIYMKNHSCEVAKPALARDNA